MPVLGSDAVARALAKGNLARAYYLLGAEDVLKDEILHTILDRGLDPATRDFNFDQRSAQSLEPEELGSLCQTLPMMAERRVVLIRDVEAWKRKPSARAAMLRYLEHPAEETLVILLQGSAEAGEDKDLARLTTAVRFDPVSPERAVEWVQHRARERGTRLEPDAAEHLVRSVGAELGCLAAELEKLAALPADEALTAARVGELVGIRHGETIFDWRDAVLEDRPARAASLLGPVLSQPGVSGVKLVMLMGTTLVGVGIARSRYDAGIRGRSLEDAMFKAMLRNRPFGLLAYKEEASRWTRWAPRWPAARVRAALRAALRADQSLKSTTISNELGILTDLVLGLADATRVAA